MTWCLVKHGDNFTFSNIKEATIGWACGYDESAYTWGNLLANVYSQDSAGD